MPQEYIEIRGARENNLKDASGSGKSSLVFDTIANEAQRLLFENFSMCVCNFLPRYPRPGVDSIENLSMAVIVDQKRLGGGAHSTVTNDTIPIPEHKRLPNLTVLSVSPLLGEVIRRAHDGRSVGEMFNE